VNRRRALVSSAVFVLALAVTAVGGAVSTAAGISLTAVDTAYTQDFDTLASTSTSSTVPDGWAFSEALANANATYTAGTGSGNAGDTYSFGAAGSTERAFGGLQSGTLNPTIGAAFSNDTGATIVGVDVAYTGEQWRVGTANRPDRLDFQYSLDATSLTTGTWVDVDALDYSETSGATTGAVPGLTTPVSGTIAGLAIASGSSFWIRWTDFNASGADDGLAVDDFSLTPHTGTVNALPTVTCPANLTVDQGTAFSRPVSASDADGTIASITVDSVTPSSGAASFSISDFTGGTSATANVNGDASLAPGAYAVQLRAANDDAAPQSATCSFTVTVAPPPTILPIGTVQGSVGDPADGATFDSPFLNQVVTVQGVVTELTREGANRGFFLQNTAATADTDPTTSDGVFVFMSTHDDLVNGYVPKVGDEIRLTGRVNEFFHQTELGTASATKVGEGSVEPFTAEPPDDAGDAARYWERREGMLASVPAGSTVAAPTHLFTSTQDTEFYVVTPTSIPGQRANPFAQRTFRDAHPLDHSASKIDITDEGVKVGNPTAHLVPVHTFQKVAAPIVGGVYFDFGKYSVSASAQPSISGGADPSQNDAPPAFDRSQAFSVANFNMENLYDFRDDPNDPCDFTGNPGCPGVSPPFDYVPASDAEYQGRETEIAHQVVDDLHSPDVIAVAEAEDQDICSIVSGAMSCGTADNADGQPDDLEELALKIEALGGGHYLAAFDRNGADARGIIVAFMYRTDRVQLLPASAGDAVLGSSPTVQYRTPGLAFDTDVSNPKALNAVLPTDIETPNDTDGSNVFTRAVQVAHFRVVSTTAVGTPDDVWILANHFSSGPDTRVGQRREQAAYNAAVVKAIQGQEPDAKVMVAGDLNVFPRPDDPFLPDRNSDQLAALYDAGLHNLYDTVLADNPAGAYSYVFDGNAQDLDHQFVTDSWFHDLQQVHEAHINADWPRVPGSNRGTSDHDPMVSQWRLKLDAAPTVDAGGPYSVNEGGTVSLTATATDPDGDALSYAWDLDGDGSFETTGSTVDFHAGDGPAAVTVTVKATDTFGVSSTDTATVDVANVPPTAVLDAPASATAGIPFSISLTSAGDPSAADRSAGFRYAFDCGDGYGPFGASASTSCRALVLGTTVVRATIKDKDGGSTEYTASVKLGASFAGVCEVAKAYSSSGKAAQVICDLLARAQADAARGRRVQVALDLTVTAAAVVADTVVHVFTPAERDELLRQIARLS